MYANCVIRDTIRIPPAELGNKIEESIVKQAKNVYEGILDEELGVIVAVIGVNNIGEGRIVPGDGAAYYEADISLITYKPKIQELIEGEVTDVTEFGAFIKTGPIDALVHVSQIMDDYINYDSKLPGFVGKESKKKLTKKDVVLARVVTLSLKGTIANSKVGLTMRQPGLGKPEWAKIDMKKKKDSKEKEKKE
ncbi:MAG: DNA-directed RNA polymerase [Candidatus Diapherotrites archaeon]